jgi:hypothetical protein
VNQYVWQAIIFTGLGAIFLYRAITGNTPATGPVSLSQSPLPAANRRQRWMNTGLGVAFLSFGAIYIVLAYMRHAHS